MQSGISTAGEPVRGGWHRPCSGLMPNLFLVESRRNLGVGMCVDIRIDTEGNAHALTGCLCQFVDDIQFGKALHVEATDALRGVRLDFAVALAYTGIDNAFGREARRSSR